MWMNSKSRWKIMKFFNLKQYHKTCSQTLFSSFYAPCISKKMYECTTLLCPEDFNRIYRNNFRFLFYILLFISPTERHFPPMVSNNSKYIHILIWGLFVFDGPLNKFTILLWHDDVKNTKHENEKDFQTVGSFFCSLSPSLSLHSTLVEEICHKTEWMNEWFVAN